MHWKDYYYKIPYKNFNSTLVFLEKKSFKTVFFLILIIYFALNGFQLVFSFSLLFFIFVSFLYHPILLIMVYGRKDISVYLNNKSYHLALNQDALYKTHRSYRDMRIFFFTSKKHNYDKKIEEKIAYIEALEIYFINRGKDQPYLNISHHTSIVFLLSSLSISSLIYFIDSSSIAFPNLLFLVSVLFIINIISQGHRIFVNQYATLYYRKLKRKILKNYKSINFKISYGIKENKNDELGRNSTDIVGVIVGVLFSLYVTLIFNKIYPVQTEPKIIIDKNVTQYIKQIVYEKKE